MRAISNEIRELISSGAIIGDNAPSCKVVWVNGSGTETVIPQVQSVNINKEESSFSQSCDITLLNVNPTDYADYGYYNPHRDDTAHNKPKVTAWFKVLVPNVEIRVYMGYGSSLVKVFTGLIDTLDIITMPAECTLTIKCRDIGKLLLDKMCNSTLSYSKQYSIEYPLDVTADTVFLTSTDLNPTIEDMVKDICIRAGFESADIATEVSGMNLESIDGFIEFIEKPWSDCIEELKTITGFDFWIDEDGKVNFKHPQSKNIAVTDESVYMTGTAWQNLAMPQVVESSIVVKNSSGSITYDEVDDYLFDPSTNSIKRATGSSISSGQLVKVSYQTVDYVFKNGVNIFQLPLTMSHDKVYGKILVRGDTEEYIANVSSDFKLWDGSQIMEDKILIIEDTSLFTQADCQALAERLVLDMKERYISVEFECIPVPHLQLRDIVQIIVYGTIAEGYIIDGITLGYEAGASLMSMRIKTHHFAYASI